MKIVIYGAGFYGKKCFQFLSSIDARVDFFCQTCVDSEHSLMGIPIIDVKQLSMLNDDIMIFLAISNRNISDEIRKKLRQEIDCIINIYNFCDWLSENDLLYTGRDFEIKIMRHYWKTYFDNPEILQNVTAKLCNGLASEDEIKINRIIDRMRHFVLEDSLNCDIFTLSEKQQINDMERDMSENSGNGVSEGMPFYCYRNYKLYDNCFASGVFYYKLGLQQINNLEKVKRKNIIDVGAYMGDSAIVLSEYTSQKVYAFEAFYDNYRKISETAALNEKTNIVPINVALGEDKSIKSFYLRNDTDAGHGMLERENLPYKGRIDVKQITLDEYVEDQKLEVGLIKVDIEGAERSFLQGAQNTICLQKPVLIISIYHTAADFFEIKSMIEQLGAGYSFQVFQPITRSRFLLETALVCEVI